MHRRLLRPRESLDLVQTAARCGWPVLQVLTVDQKITFEFMGCNYLAFVSSVVVKDVEANETAQRGCGFASSATAPPSGGLPACRLNPNPPPGDSPALAASWGRRAPSSSRPCTTPASR